MHADSAKMARIPSVSASKTTAERAVQTVRRQRGTPCEQGFGEQGPFGPKIGPTSLETRHTLKRDQSVGKVDSNEVTGEDTICMSYNRNK